MEQTLIDIRTIYWQKGDSIACILTLVENCAIDTIISNYIKTTVTVDRPALPISGTSIIKPFEAGLIFSVTKDEVQVLSMVDSAWLDDYIRSASIL